MVLRAGSVLNLYYCPTLPPGPSQCPGSFSNHHTGLPVSTSVPIKVQVHGSSCVPCTDSLHFMQGHALQGGFLHCHIALQKVCAGCQGIVASMHSGGKYDWGSCVQCTNTLHCMQRHVLQGGLNHHKVDCMAAGVCCLSANIGIRALMHGFFWGSCVRCTDTLHCMQRHAVQGGFVCMGRVHRSRFVLPVSTFCLTCVHAGNMSGVKKRDSWLCL